MNGRWCRAIRAALIFPALLATCSLVLAQSAALVPNAKQQFFNADGTPLANGSVYSYVPNTTTSKSTWSDENEGALNSQPVTLDSGGYATIFGQGNYRQIVKDANGNTVWDGFTSTVGASVPSGASAHDTAPVGSVMAFSGFTLPTNWQLAYGQALSRSTYSDLLSALTIATTTGGCTNTSTTITGFSATVQIPVGATIESTCLPPGTTVSSITNATTIVASAAATSTGTFTVTVFPWGNGNGSTTFNVPDLRGRVFAGADCLGSTLQSGAGCASRLTSSFFTNGGQAPAETGGSQNRSVTIAQANLPVVTLSTAIAIGQGSHTHAAVVSGGTVGGTTSTSVTGAGAVPAPITPSNIVVTNTAATLPAMTGTTPLGGSGTDLNFSVVQPTVTVSYIIKVAANTSGLGGVVSVGGMFGDIVCDATMTCAPQASVNTIGASGQFTTANANSLLMRGPTRPGGTFISFDSYDSGSGGLNSAYFGTIAAQNDDGYSDGLYFDYQRLTAPHTSQSNDFVGLLHWRGYDSASYQDMAEMYAQVEGSPSAGSMPGRLVFATTPSGTATPVERVRINATGTTFLEFGVGLTTPVTKTTSFTASANVFSYICNGSGSITVTLPSASATAGANQVLFLKTIAAQTVVSASANVVPLAGGSAATGILAATAGKWAILQSDGTNWNILAAN